MVYVDTTLTIGGGYSYINTGQVYGAIATALTAHSNWEYVEFINATTHPTYSYRHHIWRCKAAGSGLPADFFVSFKVPYVTASGLYQTDWAVPIYLGEYYSGGVLGKYATNNHYSTVTPSSDLTNPETWTLSNYVTPNTIFASGNSFGTQSNVTSLRMLYLVAADHIMMTRAEYAGNIIAATNVLYAGAYESVMSPTDDPMPIVLLGTSFNATYVPGGFTRAVLTTPGVAALDTFGAATYDGGTTTPMANSGVGRNPTVPLTGQPGTAATTTYWKNLGPTVSKCAVNSYLNTAAEGSTKGIFRGYLKDVVCASLAAHAFGDTFRVDGNTYAGVGLTGNAPLINTQAA